MADQEKTIELGVVSDGAVFPNAVSASKEAKQVKHISAKISRISKTEVWVVVDGCGKIVPRDAITEDALKVGDTVSLPSAIFKTKKK